MNLSESIVIDTPRDQVWNIISDIEHAAERIAGINKLEVLEKPKDGLVGLKWRETRTMFGKEATETMWITEESPGDGYQTRAESHGAVYISRFSLSEKEGKTELTMSFDSQSVTFFAKILNWIFSSAMKKSIVGVIQEDLRDIKTAAEVSH